MFYYEQKPILLRDVPSWLAIFVLIVISVITVVIIRKDAAQFSSDIPVLTFIRKEADIPEPVDPKWKFKPGPISMDVLKKQGCVADGFLSEYGDDTKRMTKVINRSECAYLHRALETWADPPNFKKAEEIMSRVTRDPIVYGMFIAEALRTNVDYKFADQDRDFRFGNMCRDGTENRWGDNICTPDFNKKEYQRYVGYITRHAMDIGIQSFLFGQIYLQDTSFSEKSEISKIISGMRKYAKEKGMQIVIGAQTNSITDEKYLKNFDYIEGGVGIDSEGNIEDGPCLSKRSGCWALLWNKSFASKAKNVFLHLDWSGITSDDMSIFARMDHGTRIKTLGNLYQYFTARNMGFMMPFLAVINRDNGGCHGPSREFYTPDNKYTCDDENDINAIFRGNTGTISAGRYRN
jgi:hypothetical protein